VRHYTSGELRAQEERELFLQAISNLTVDQRQVLQLRIDERLSFEAIGRQTNRSADAARKLFVRAVESLQQDLMPHHDEHIASNGDQR